MATGCYLISLYRMRACGQFSPLHPVVITQAAFALSNVCGGTLEQIRLGRQYLPSLFEGL